MAFSVEVQSCQSRPQTSSNNKSNIDTTNDKFNHIRKSRRDTIDDPGAINSTNTRAAKTIENRVQNRTIEIVSDTNKYIIVSSATKNSLDKKFGDRPGSDRIGSTTKKANENSNAHYKNTLFTKFGTHSGINETEFTNRERFSKKLKPSYGIARNNKLLLSPSEYKLPSFNGKHFKQNLRLQLQLHWERPAQSEFLSNYIFESKSKRKSIEPNPESRVTATKAFDIGIDGRDSVDQCRRIPHHGNEWSNAAYCYS